MNNLELQAELENIQAQLGDLKARIEAPELPTMIALPDRAYSVAETPVTVAQYNAFCLDTGKSLRIQPSPKRQDNPVVNVTFNDAREYCAWLSNKTGSSYRLPTEDEFEHFCGDHQEADESIAVYNQGQITAVKTKNPNKYGLYDVLGLVWEWQDSLYEKNLNSLVVRGGSWFENRFGARCASRDWVRPGSFDDDLGFRLVLHPTLNLEE